MTSQVFRMVNEVFVRGCEGLRRRWPLGSMARCRLVVLLSASAIYCGPRTEPLDTSEPIAECQQYNAEFAACFHRDAPAMSLGLATASKAERENSRALCVTDIKRLKEACR